MDNQKMNDILRTAITASEILIKKSGVRLKAAIEYQEWGNATEIESYISGMVQMKVVFEQAINELKKEQENEKNNR